ncbi:MAG: type IV pili twitching motility protein PilT [Chloroflexi bacterium RBG_13_51_36]|nr:MAG: type IV pili twitching motility protein PilT [Chloroflexi bacterium RBG_13_51_36]
MDVFSLLRTGNSRRASDLHMVAGSPASFRIDGSLQPANGVAALSPEDISEAFLQLTTPEEREHFHNHLELDFGYTLPDVGRLRCNAAQQRGSISLAVRLLPPKIPTIDELELPPLCKELAMKQRGLVVITGPTGSGKSTTLAAMIQHLNTNDTRHVVTIEDPIEYVHTSIKCAVTQRQLGTDTLSFANALKHILRQDPDVILVGEMRDPDTADAVLTVAETGHFILTTGHAPSASQAMERIIDLFPPHQRHLAQTRLASLLVAALCQVLVPRADGSGRVAAVEIMLGNPAAKSLIREGKLYQLPNVIRTHRDIGMISLDEALVSLYLKGIISGKTLLDFCNDRQEVEKLIGKVKL